MRFTGNLLILSLILMPVSLEAKKTETSYKNGFGFSNGFAVTSSYLPARFPRYDFDTRKWDDVIVNGCGLGVDYNLSILPLSLRWYFRTGFGFTYSKIDESGNKRFEDYHFMGIEPGLSDPISYDAYFETQREYAYVYLPIVMGYRLYSRGNFKISPYLGIRGKYNISYIEKGYVESATWNNHYFELFDKSTVKSEVTRFIIQAEAGVEFEYNKLFMTLGFLRDTKRMYKEAYIKKSDRSYRGPYTFNCWQLGLGVKL